MERIKLLCFFTDKVLARETVGRLFTDLADSQFREMCNICLVFNSKNYTSETLKASVS